MWEIKNNQQVFSFCAAVVFGVAYCLFYDFFRAWHRVFKSKTLSVFVGDVIFFIIIAVATFLLLLAVCNGEIRAYVFVGILLGAVLCNLTLSRLFLIALTFVIKKAVLIKRWIKVFFDRMARAFLLKFSKLVVFFKKKAKKCIKYLKNHLKQTA